MDDTLTTLSDWRGLPLPPLGHDFCDQEIEAWTRCPDQDPECTACHPTTEGDPR